MAIARLPRERMQSRAVTAANPVTYAGPVLLLRGGARNADAVKNGGLVAAGTSIIGICGHRASPTYTLAQR